jgi:hypothetical protein
VLEDRPQGAPSGKGATAAIDIVPRLGQLTRTDKAS